MKDKQYYIDLFKELMELYEFRVYKATNENGDEILKVEDLQRGNIGDIESDEFNDCCDILERMECYHDDYIVKALADYLDYADNIADEWATWQDLYNITSNHIEELAECEFDIRALELILNPQHLENIKIETM